MSAPQTQLGSTFNVVTLPFQGTDFANADGTLFTAQATTPEYVMPTRGSIIGVSGGLNGTLVTGTLTPQAMIDGSLCPIFPDAAAVRTNQQYGYYMQEARKENYTFTAGQRLGMIVDKAGTVSPTTRDGAFLLVVLLEGVRY